MSRDFSYSINEAPLPEMKNNEIPSNSSDNYTDINLDILKMAETTLIPPPTRKISPDPMYHNDYFKVDKSEVAGWGAFAAKNLTKGDVILREIPLFVADTDKIFHEFYKLDKNTMDVALSLHSHQLIKGGTPRILGIWQTNWQVWIRFTILTYQLD
jgi:hypothetical protein